ncbi:MAG: T9SS type A sorting domain-containing protein [Saprospiraceae bacterium]|nr:T9SS type A sorting domain-containing protein [Saprospiraceae bacterium]
MRKFLYLIGIISSISFHYIRAQPIALWNKTYGGSSFDIGRSIINSTNGGYILAGYTASQDGNIFGARGGNDFWVVKLSNLGDIQWKKNLGGTENDWAVKIIQTVDGGYFVVGYSGSNNIDVSGNHGGLYDGWVVKLNTSGMIEWQKCLGGSQIDLLLNVIQTSDNGYLVAGYSNSNDGDIAGNHGDFDALLIKLSSDGSIEWQKSLGGSAEDDCKSVLETQDGGYLMVGETRSVDGDVNKLHEDADYWVVKLSNQGEIEWNTTLGGDNADIGVDVVISRDSGYLIMGYSGSIDVPNHHGAFDYYLVKLTNTGSVVWEKAFGGSGPDWARGVILDKNDGYIITGETESKDGDIDNSTVGHDIWLIKIDEQGELVWKKIIGGSKADGSLSITPSVNNEIVITGYSNSTDGDFMGCKNKGKDDLFIIKLTLESSAATSPSNLPLTISPNPSTTSIYLQGLENENNISITLSNLLGQTILQKQISPDEQINVSNLPKGLYLVSAIGENNKTYLGKFEKL